MKKLISLLKEAYEKRDCTMIDSIASYFTEDCYVIGTSLGELGKGKEALKELLESDFRYWVDIDINEDYTMNTYGEYKVYQINATGLYKFNINEGYYDRYVGYMNQIRNETRDEYYKAIKVMWQLDHVLASKPKVRHKDYKKISIILIEKDNLLRLISYEFEREKNHIDCAEGFEDDMNEEYLTDVSSINDDKEIDRYIQNHLKIDGLLFEELQVERSEDIFLGCGKIINHESIEQELMKDFTVLDQEISSYDKLYRLRKQLGETLRMYSIGEKQKIMVRIFGIFENKEISYVHHSYPFYWIFED